MKKILPFMILLLLSMVFLSNRVSAQNYNDISIKLQLRLHKYFDFYGNGQYGFEDATKSQKRIRLKDCSEECIGFVDEDGDGICDNCGGVGILDRTRDKEGKGSKRRGGYQ